MTVKSSPLNARAICILGAELCRWQICHVSSKTGLIDIVCLCGNVGAIERNLQGQQEKGKVGDILSVSDEIFHISVASR